MRLKRASFFRDSERLKLIFDISGEICEVFARLDSDEKDSRMLFIREESEVAERDVERLVVANARESFLYVRKYRVGDVADKFQCDVDAFGPHPARAATNFGEVVHQSAEFAASFFRNVEGYEKAHARPSVLLRRKGGGGSCRGWPAWLDDGFCRDRRGSGRRAPWRSFRLRRQCGRGRRAFREFHRRGRR